MGKSALGSVEGVMGKREIGSVSGDFGVSVDDGSAIVAALQERIDAV